MPSFEQSQAHRKCRLAAPLFSGIVDFPEGSDTQRNLYSFALFNEVNTAVENPAGDATAKTILLQVAEARRWTLTYGFGFEVQTWSTPEQLLRRVLCRRGLQPQRQDRSQPPRADRHYAQRHFWPAQSASLQGTYGLLEQSVGIQYQVPHIEGNPNFGFTFSGGYANSQDVSTYVASRLEGAFRLTENFNDPESWLSRANTFIYDLHFRRLKWRPAACRFTRVRFRSSRLRRVWAAPPSHGFATDAMCRWMRAGAPTPVFRSFYLTGHCAQAEF